MSTLADWMLAASPTEKTQLAEKAGTSVEYLTSLSRGYGNRTPSVALALAIEKTTIEMSKLERSKLPVVTCEDLARGV